MKFDVRVLELDDVLVDQIHQSIGNVMNIIDENKRGIYWWESNVYEVLENNEHIHEQIMFTPMKVIRDKDAKIVLNKFKINEKWIEKHDDQNEK